MPIRPIPAAPDKSDPTYANYLVIYADLGSGESVLPVGGDAAPTCSPVNHMGFMGDTSATSSYSFEASAYGVAMRRLAITQVVRAEGRYQIDDSDGLHDIDLVLHDTEINALHSGYQVQGLGCRSIRGYQPGHGLR